jgi:23S rRNA U2552 (ribose-2'-O)-methylase RlmE/FtsJ
MSILCLPVSPRQIVPENIKLTISDDEQPCYIGGTLCMYLNRVKILIDDYIVDWDNVKKTTNTYEYIHTVIPHRKYSVSKHKPLSRAFFKLIEMCNTLRIFDKYANDPINTFHLAEGPGGFIEAMTYMRDNQDDVYNGMTLIDNTDDKIPGWKNSEFFLIKTKNVNIEKGVDGTGDLYSVENLDYCKEKYANSIDFITADGGFDFSVDFNRQESVAIKLILAEVIYALVMQKLGGTLIIKVFDNFIKATIDIIYLLTCQYESVKIIKPYTSRIANSERYIVCTGFNKIMNNDLFNKLREEIDTIGDSNICSLLDIQLPYKFIKTIEEANAVMAYKQIDNIRSTIRFIENKERKGDKMRQLRDSNIKRCVLWCESNNIPHNTTSTTYNTFKPDIRKRNSHVFG